MCRSLLVPGAFALLAPFLCSGSPADDFPAYSSSSIVNGASFRNEPLAPGTIGTIYGENLAWDIASGGSAPGGSTLPSHLGFSGPTVLVGGVPAGLFYVSPKQINFLVPTVLLPGKVSVSVVRDGRAGPQVALQVAPASPALFQLDPDYAVVTRPDGSLIDRDHPAQAGEIVLLYATGLGDLLRPLYDREIPRTAMRIARAAEFDVLLNGVTVPRDSIQYVGAAPGFAGLYQVNLKLPSPLDADPEIRIVLGQAASKPGLRLHASGAPGS